MTAPCGPASGRSERDARAGRLLSNDRDSLAHRRHRRKCSQNCSQPLALSTRSCWFTLTAQRVLGRHIRRASPIPDTRQVHSPTTTQPFGLPRLSAPDETSVIAAFCDARGTLFLRTPGPQQPPSQTTPYHLTRTLTRNGTLHPKFPGVRTGVHLQGAH